MDSTSWLHLLMSTALRIENLWKQYRLGVLGQGTLCKDLQSWWARRCGREDLNSPINFGSDVNEVSQGKIWALQDISLDVKQGEVLGIIGRNGAGKSTLLKILSRVTAPTRGKVKIKGRLASLLEVGTGFHPELTGRENIFLNAAILGMTVNEINRKFDKIVDFSGVEQFIDTPVKRYSSGMYVRLAFAVAAHLEPEVLIVDEVLAVGDIQFQKKCLGKLEDIVQEGRTILFVSHGMSAIKRLCQRCILLDKGKVTLDGEVNQVVNHYLNSGLERGNATACFPDTPSSPIFLRRAILKNDQGVPTVLFNVGNQIFLQIDYVVRNTLRHSMILFTVSRDGTYIFSSHDTDLRHKLLEERSPGEYSTMVAMPAKLLTAGSYNLSLAAVVGPTGEHHHTGYYDVLTFEINDEVLDPFLSYTQNRGTLVIAELEWKTWKTENLSSHSIAEP
jgi:lipopolysaccharide transport system ATP-binding protein